jgi:hypothetical protein
VAHPCDDDESSENQKRTDEATSREMKPPPEDWRVRGRDEISVHDFGLPLAQANRDCADCQKPDDTQAPRNEEQDASGDKEDTDKNYKNVH